MKGISFNVTLSEEQMDYIASLAADKIDYTFRRLKQNDTWYDGRIEDLERQLKQRDALIVEQELRMSSLNRIIDLYKQKLEEQSNKE